MDRRVEREIVNNDVFLRIDSRVRAIPSFDCRMLRTNRVATINRRIQDRLIHFINWNRYQLRAQPINENRRRHLLDRERLSELFENEGVVVIVKVRRRGTAFRRLFGHRLMGHKPSKSEQAQRSVKGDYDGARGETKTQNEPKRTEGGETKTDGRNVRERAIGFIRDLGSAMRKTCRRCCQRRTEEIDEEYTDKVMNDAAPAAAAAAPSSRKKKNRKQERKDESATSDKDTVSKQKRNGSGVVTGARLRSDRSNSKSRRHIKSVEFASLDDPAHQALGLDVDDPLDVRPWDPIVWSHPVKSPRKPATRLVVKHEISSICKAVRKPANRLVVKQEKSSIFL